MRGYSIFIIIQEIMHRTFVELEGRAPRRHEIPKPADYFDLIVGTGTGGLIALMLGRLRLDMETCKELYVRLTRIVFETDKTILGIPTRPTLFKASKLEEAIKEAVREHTLDDGEGNDGSENAPFGANPLGVAARSSAAASNPRRHSSNASVVSFSARSPAAQFSRPYFASRGGDPDARLYDSRQNRTKTLVPLPLGARVRADIDSAVTAMYKGSPKGEPSVMLRSYDSRREPPPEFDCKIWEAGRATCAIGLAFKPIVIGQSVFHDDGAGTFNPSPEALDEAVVNEWPGREVGVFVSVGTGKRPRTNDTNQSMWYEGLLGEFAEARRKLVAKIEGCESIHEYMVKEHLLARGVNAENYYRLNVEVGVGEFGMNEWNRLAEISTGTRRYLSRPAERNMVQNAAVKLAKIQRANLRLDRLSDVPELTQTAPDIPEPFAVELEGDIPTFPVHHTPRQSYESGPDTLSPLPGTPSPRSSGEQVRSPVPPSPARPSAGSPKVRASQPLRAGVAAGSSPKVDDDRLVVTAPTPAQWRTASGQEKLAEIAADEHPRRHNEPIMNRWGNGQQLNRIEPPPLPPKTPLPENRNRRSGGNILPYPTDEEAPPPVDMTRKPHYRG